MLPHYKKVSHSLAKRTMATITQKGNVWYAVYRVNGQQIKKSTCEKVLPKVFIGSKKQAMATSKARALLIAEHFEKEERAGRQVSAEYLTEVSPDTPLAVRYEEDSIESYLTKWLSSRKSTLRAYERDKKAITQFLAFLGTRKNMKASALDSKTTREFVAHETERVSSNTVARYISVLSTAYTDGIKNELFVKNPFFGASPTRKQIEREKHIREAFTLEEIKVLIEKLPEEWSDMVQVCLYTGGQRLGDIATMKWEQVDFEANHLYMVAQKTQRQMKKPLFDKLKEVLTRRFEARSTEYVFPIASLKYNQATNKSALSTEFVNLIADLGIVEKPTQKKDGDRRAYSSKSFHSLRATAVTILRNAGVPVDLCRYIVGHNSELVERLYYRPTDSDVTKALANIDL